RVVEALETHHLLMKIEGDEQELANVPLLETFPVGVGKTAIEGEDREIALGAADRNGQALLFHPVFARLAEEALSHRTEWRQVAPIERQEALHPIGAAQVDAVG